MTGAERDRLFRACVTAHLADLRVSEPLRGVTLSLEDWMSLTGIGVAMTGNVIGMLAESLETTPEKMWEIICQIGREKGLPGMAP